MSIGDDICELSEVEARCLGLMSSLVGACAGEYGTDSTQKCIDLLSRYPHMLVEMVDAAHAFVEGVTSDEGFERRILHPGPLGVVSNPPADEEGT